MLYPIWPLYLTTTLGASMVALGLTEGLADLIAGVLKIYAGRWSDRLGKRRVFVFWGYMIAAVAKPLTGMSTHWLQALFGRGLDRMGKGLRTAPRDALLADWSPPDQLGRVFGFHRGMDTAGATLGPLLTLLILFLVPGMPLSQLFIWALIPGLIAAFLVLKVPEKKPLALPANQQPLKESLSRFPPQFYFYLFVWTLFSVANSSDVFLLLRVQEIGGDQTAVILCYCFYNLVYALLSYPAGKLSDSWSREKVFGIGLLIFAGLYGIFAVTHSWTGILIGLFFYGIFSAATDGVGKALIVSVAPKEQKATAIGLFVGFSGLSSLTASVLCGWIWDRWGSFWAFGLSSGLALAAALVFFILLAKKGSGSGNFWKLENKASQS